MPEFIDCAETANRAAVSDVDVVVIVKCQSTGGEFRLSRAGTFPLAQEVAVLVENLDAVTVIGDKNFAFAVYYRMQWFVKLPIAFTRSLPFGEEVPVAIKLLHPRIKQVCHVDVTFTVESWHGSAGKLAVAVA